MPTWIVWVGEMGRNFQADWSARRAEDVTVLVSAVLTVDSIVNLSPSFAAAHDARDALERLLVEMAPDWQEAAADAIRAHVVRNREAAEDLHAESLRQLFGVIKPEPGG